MESTDRFVGLEVNLHETKTLILGIYASNKDKVLIYKGLIERIMGFSYEHWYLIGDWNEVIFWKNIKIFLNIELATVYIFYHLNSNLSTIFSVKNITI